MPIGRVVGDDLRVVGCPVCSVPCIAELKGKGWQFTHRGALVSSPRRLKFEATSAHHLEPELLDQLVKLGAVRLTRHQSIGHTLEAAPAVVKQLRVQRAARRKELGLE